MHQRDWHRASADGSRRSRALGRSDAEVCALLAQQGVKLIAMRCAGFDRVDVAAAAKHGITVVRVPSYSPHAARWARRAYARQRTRS